MACGTAMVATVSPAVMSRPNAFHEYDRSDSRAGTRLYSHSREPSRGTAPAAGASGGDHDCSMKLPPHPEQVVLRPDEDHAVGDGRRRHARVVDRVRRQELELGPRLDHPDAALLAGEVDPAI